MSRITAFSFSLLALLCCAGVAEAADMATGQPPTSFTGKDASGVIANALVQAGAGNDIAISIAQARDEDVLASSSGTIAADANDVTFDAGQHRWQATLQLQENGRTLAPLKLFGHYDEMLEVPVLKRQVTPGDIISEQDVDIEKRPSSAVNKSLITDAQMLIGKAPKHVIAAGRPVRINEVAGAILVNRGERVTMVYRSQNLEIKTFGEALESGAKGDVIRVRNLSSKAVIQAVVDSAALVRVASPDNSDSAEAM